MNILDNITLCFCSFNNNKLSALLIKSLFKQIGRYIPVVIVDNGNKELMSDDMKSIFTVIDNSNYKITGNQNQNSRNHCAAVDYALKNCIKTKYVLLTDSDILFKPSVKKLFESLNAEKLETLGEIWGNNDRIMPMFCIINLEKFKNENINFYDPKRCMNNFTSIWDDNGNYIKDIIKPDKWYGDTGASFLWDILKNGWNITKIKISDYIEHYGRGSFAKDKKITVNQWLEIHKDLWK